MVEVMAAIIISLGVGSYLGIKAGEEKVLEEKPKLQRRADTWTPGEHERLLQICARSCGRRGLQEYDFLYGKCECKRR